MFGLTGRVNRNNKNRDNRWRRPSRPKTNERVKQEILASSFSSSSSSEDPKGNNQTGVGQRRENTNNRNNERKRSEVGNRGSYYRPPTNRSNSRYRRSNSNSSTKPRNINSRDNRTGDRKRNRKGGKNMWYSSRNKEDEQLVISTSSAESNSDSPNFKTNNDPSNLSSSSSSETSSEDSEVRKSSRNNNGNGSITITYEEFKKLEGDIEAINNYIDEKEKRDRRIIEILTERVSKLEAKLVDNEKKTPEICKSVSEADDSTEISEITDDSDIDNTTNNNTTNNNTMTNIHPDKEEEIETPVEIPNPDEKSKVDEQKEEKIELPTPDEEQSKAGEQEIEESVEEEKVEEEVKEEQPDGENYLPFFYNKENYHDGDMSAITNGEVHLSVTLNSIAKPLVLYPFGLGEVSKDLFSEEDVSFEFRTEDNKEGYVYGKSENNNGVYRISLNEFVIEDTDVLSSEIPLPIQLKYITDTRDDNSLDNNNNNDESEDEFQVTMLSDSISPDAYKTMKSIDEMLGSEVNEEEIPEPKVNETETNEPEPAEVEVNEPETTEVEVNGSKVAEPDRDFPLPVPDITLDRIIGGVNNEVLDTVEKVLDENPGLLRSFNKDFLKNLPPIPTLRKNNM